jgi:PKD repeat protein
LNRSPVAAFTEDATTVAENETIHFDASGSYDPDGTIDSFEWDFGDGTTAIEVTTEHAYTIEAGTHTVTLTVTDDDGASSSVTAEKIVETQETVTLAVISVIGLGVAALTATLLYGLFVRRSKKKKNSFSQAYARTYSKL